MPNEIENLSFVDVILNSQIA